MCKFKPCKNRFCPYKHEEGQRGVFPDKVWTADGGRSHVSERKFVDHNGAEEFIIPGEEEGEGEGQRESAAQDAAAMDASIA
jgi:hypothetical protein